MYFYAAFQKLMKTEQTIEKSVNFYQTILNTWTNFSQNFNVVASFVLQLLGFVFYIYIYIFIYIYIIYLCSFSEINKNKQTIEKLLNFA